ncbi:MAG: DUF4347 domain-containing protein [Cyanobacteria bacterium P01_A01_bin.3]
MNAYAPIDGQDTAVAPTSPVTIQEQGFLPTSRANSLIFVDSSVENAEQLIAGVSQDAKVIYLDSSKDGISSITAALSQYKDVESVHILSHGDTDSVQLGSSELSSETVDNYQGQLNNWRSSLTGSADILFYGCNIADSSDGLGLVNQLSQYTGADIAASTDLTGSSALGGDWDLEYATGDIEAKTPFSAKATSSYDSVLKNFSHDFNGGLSGKFRVQSKTKHGVNVVSNPRGSGKAVRFDLRRGDPKVSNSFRSELVPKVNDTKFGQTYTYEFRTYIPNDWKSDNSSDTIFQWHSKPNKGESYNRPPVALSVQGGKYSLKIRSDADRNTNTKKKGTFKESTPWTGTLKKGQWVSWRVQAKWSYNSNGQFKMWQNGRQVLNFNGANTYNDPSAPYVKFGIYKPDWKGNPGKSSSSRRVLYFDDFKFSQGARSSSASLAPEPDPTPSSPASSSKSNNSSSGGGYEKVFQAESARRSGSITLHKGRGAQGRYADFQKNSGEWIEWDVYVDSSGNYDLDWQYALGSGSRPLQLSVNGSVKDSSLDFSNTGGWSNWKTSSKNGIYLRQGNNKIRLRANGSSGANFDYLKVKSA